jgi:TRAP-type C4-dicarboxylate transport system permease small subunit
MDKFFKAIQKVEEFCLVVLMAVMIIVVFFATFGRYTQLYSWGWSDELARYCMIWIVFLGLGVAAMKGGHFVVNALDLFLPKTALKVIKVIDAIIVCIFNILASKYAIQVIQAQMKSGQITPSLNVPMWWIYLAIPVGLLIMAACYLYHTLREVTGKLTAEEIKEEEEAGEV